MQSILELAIRLSIFYVFIFLGFLTTRITARTKRINKIISTILLYILMPFLILNTLLTFSTELVIELPIILIFVVLVHLIGFFLLILRFKTLDLQKEVKGALLLCVTFNNALFLPVPLILIFIGESGIPVIAIFSIVQMILTVSLGLLIGSYYSGIQVNWKYSLKKILLFPPFLAALLGVSLLMFGLSLPTEISTMLSYIGTFTTFLALFVVGLSIGTLPSLTEILRSFEVVLIRQFIVPIIIFFLLLISGLSEISRNVLLIQALMPPAVFMVVYATEFGLDSEAAATTVTLGTIVLLPIVPFIPLLLS